MKKDFLYNDYFTSTLNGMRVFKCGDGEYALETEGDCITTDCNEIDEETLEAIEAITDWESISYEVEKNFDDLGNALGSFSIAAWITVKEEIDE